MTHYELDKAAGLSCADIAISSMIEALQASTENEYIDLREPYDPLPPKTWPSTLAYVDKHAGGFYGVSACTAEKGSGKTMLATSSAMAAAASGHWQVCMFLAEDDYDGFRERFNLNIDAHPELEDCIDNFHLFSVGRGQTPEMICADVACAVDAKMDTPILVVMDSINSIVNLGTGNYFDSLRAFGLWAMLARRISRGEASFLLTCESNKRGEAKAEQIPFWADVYLKMKKKSDNVVEMWLDKTRRTAGEGPMGKHVRTWMAQRFYLHSDIPELRIVSGGRREDLEFF